MNKSMMRFAGKKLYLCITLVFALMCTTQMRLAATALQDKEKAELTRTVEKLHKKAVEQFKEGSHWNCAVNLTTVLDLYPEFSKVDESSYYLAASLYEMGLYEGADRLYRKLLKDYPRTAYVTKAILGLQKVWFQKKDYQTSLKFYKALESHYSSSEAIYESRYYAGQTHFEMENTALALNIFRQIDKKSEYYPFALYSMGLIDLKKKA